MSKSKCQIKLEVQNPK